jgi:hypothetical protein
MYFVKFLQTPDHQAGGDQVEYRLVCSGEFFNRTVLTYDWRKSDATRILLEEPFSLLVASRPFDTYPQELCLRLTVAEVTEQATHGTSTSSLIFLPDDDIVEDICAILSLLSRRLISPVVKTMVNPGHGPPGKHCLKRIYRARSTNLHAAVPFPPGTGIGTSPRINIRDLPVHPLGKLELPPAAWFERVVSIASRSFLIPAEPAPFSDVYSAGSSKAAVS